MKSSPRVSIGIPVYNGERYLSTAVESVLQQDYEDFELIISDNASTDRTAEISREFAVADRRVRYYRNHVNIGAVPNFNRVFTLARGEFFKWLSHDDVCSPGFLRRCIDVYNQAPATVALVFPRCEFIDEHGSTLFELIEDVETRATRPWQALRKVILKRVNAQALCGLIRSDHLRRTRLKGSFAMDDMALLAELAMVGEFWEIGEILLQIRVHAANSANRCPTVRSLAIWVDPENRHRRFLLPPRTRLFFECFRSVVHVHMPPVQKLLCCLTVPMAYCELALHGHNRLLAWARDVTRPARRRLFRNSVPPSRQRSHASVNTNQS